VKTSEVALWAAKNVWLEDEDYETGRPKAEVETTLKHRHHKASKPRRKRKEDTYTEAVRMLEERRELRESQERSVRARWRDGGYKGAIDVKDFSLANPGGGPDLLDDASLSLVRGRRYALVGRNGRGKSTLLKAVARRAIPDIPERCLVHYVSQDVTLTKDEAEMLPWEIVLRADVELQMLKSKKDEEALRAVDADSAERRADDLLASLGFSEELRRRKLKALSGGWRVRTFLAAALFSKCDVLLLDEPTNHLSVGAVLWLSNELVHGDTWQDRILVVVSHDRKFLDDVSTDVLHISGVAKRLTQTKGDYATWAKRRREKKLAWDRERARRQAEIDKLKEYAGHGFKYGGSYSQISKMKMKERQADKLAKAGDERDFELKELEEDLELPLSLKSGGSLTSSLVAFKDVAFAYDSSSDDDSNNNKKQASPAAAERSPEACFLFRDVELGITSESRIVFVGENGNGKSTLLKLLVGELEPTEGAVVRSAHARFALVNQHHADQLDLAQTPLEFMRSKFPGDSSYEHDLKLRSHLASCGVTAELQNLKALVLSGGQRSRVALAAVSYVEPHVLVLDEPTNNLDLESVQALADCVKNFQGAVVCVSHDQAFVSQVATECWVVAKGKVRRAPSFEAYVNRQLDKLRNK